MIYKLKAHWLWPSVFSALRILINDPFQQEPAPSLLSQRAQISWYWCHGKICLELL